MSRSGGHGTERSAGHTDTRGHVRGGCEVDLRWSARVLRCGGQGGRSGTRHFERTAEVRTTPAGWAPQWATTHTHHECVWTSECTRVATSRARCECGRRVRPAVERPDRARPLWSARPHGARPRMTRRPAPIVRHHRTGAPVVVCALCVRCGSRGPMAVGRRPSVSEGSTAGIRGRAASYTADDEMLTRADVALASHIREGSGAGTGEPVRVEQVRALGDSESGVRTAVAALDREIQLHDEYRANDESDRHQTRWCE
jgi:hypothetical protein